MAREFCLRFDFTFRASLAFALKSRHNTKARLAGRALHFNRGGPPLRKPWHYQTAIRGDVTHWRSKPLAKIHFILIIHAHQPVGNFDSVIEKVYQRSYLPFLEHLSRHPSVRIGLHYSGALLEWLEAHHPEFLEKLGSMSERGQVEILGGGFYEPILIAIPPEDQQEQIRRMREYIKKRFGRCAPRARGSRSASGNHSFLPRWRRRKSNTRSSMTCILLPRESRQKIYSVTTSRKISAQRSK